MPFRRTARVLDFQQMVEVKEMQALEEAAQTAQAKAVEQRKRERLHTSQVIEKMLRTHLIRQLPEVMIGEINATRADVETSPEFTSNLIFILAQLNHRREYWFQCGDNKFVMKDKVAIVKSSLEFCVRISNKQSRKLSLYFKADDLSVGGYAKVSHADSYYLIGDQLKKNNQAFVWKQYDKDETATDAYNQETREACHSEYIHAKQVGLITKKHFSTKGSIVLFQANQGNETFGDYIDRVLDEKAGFSKKLAYDASLKCLSQLAQLHERGIIHGDLKLDNMLYSSEDGEIRFIDFSASCKIGENKLIQVDAELLPPEASDKTFISPATDVYAMAFCLANIWNCGVPKTLLGRHATPNFKGVVDIGAHEKSDIIALINKMFDPNPEKRPTADQAYQSMREFYQACERVRKIKKI